MRVRTVTSRRTAESFATPLLNGVLLASVVDNMETGAYMGCRHTASIASLVQQAETLPIQDTLNLREAADAVSCLTPAGTRQQNGYQRLKLLDRTGKATLQNGVAERQLAVLMQEQWSGTLAVSLPQAMRAVLQGAGLTPHSHEFDAATLAAAVALDGSGHMCRLLAEALGSGTADADGETRAKRARRAADESATGPPAEDAETASDGLVRAPPTPPTSPVDLVDDAGSAPSSPTPAASTGESTLLNKFQWNLLRSSEGNGGFVVLRADRWAVAVTPTVGVDKGEWWP